MYNKIKQYVNGYPIEGNPNESYQNQFFQVEEHQNQFFQTEERQNYCNASFIKDSEYDNYQNQFFQVEEHRPQPYQLLGCDIQSVLLNHQIFPFVIPRPTQESPDQNLLVFNTREEAEYARHVLNGVDNVGLKWPKMKDFHNGLLLSLWFHEPMTTIEHCFRAEFMNTLLSHIIDGLSRVCSFLGLQISVDVMLKYEDVEELFRNGNKRFSKAFIARFFPTLCGESYSQMIGGFLRDHAQSMEIPVNGRETPVTVTLSVGTRNGWQDGSSWSSNERNTEESEMSERTNNEEDDWMDKNEVEDSERHSMTSNWSLGTTMTPQANTSQSPAGIVRNWVRGVSPPANVLRVGRWSGWGECEDGRRIGEMTSQEKEVEESKGGLEGDGNSDSEMRFGCDSGKEEEVDDDMIDEDDSGYWEEFRFSCDFEEDEEEDVEDGEGRSEGDGRSDLEMRFGSDSGKEEEVGDDTMNGDASRDDEEDVNKDRGGMDMDLESEESGEMELYSTDNDRESMSSIDSLISRSKSCPPKIPVDNHTDFCVYTDRETPELPPAWEDADDVDDSDDTRTIVSSDDASLDYDFDLSGFNEHTKLKDAIDKGFHSVFTRFSE
ncbi:hypothetical protein BLNAU_8349 [Blattamonas nauphoetae]|uniref:Uncharacterized protein n=1 Tax=Blattamonas nauphoetae TaxID=2049346 RepID=A0ABQ9XZ03_9EUKA|nr:hypothetical protein BLNAU_8349 [Blattamonas nauphoetae]